MPLTRPIQPEARPVVDVLRRDVPRPVELPTILPFGCGPRWIGPLGKLFPICAMGLREGSSRRLPGNPSEFCHEVSMEAVWTFMVWHDEQTDPAALVDAIWPLDAAKQKG